MMTRAAALQRKSLATAPEKQKLWVSSFQSRLDLCLAVSAGRSEKLGRKALEGVECNSPSPLAVYTLEL